MALEMVMIAREPDGNGASGMIRRGSSSIPVASFDAHWTMVSVGVEGCDTPRQ
jgi:hypothetical protein